LCVLCGGCRDQPASTARTSVDNGNDRSLELVDKSCYLGDMLTADGDADTALDTRIQKGQKTHRQLAPLFTNKDVFLHMRGK